MGFFDSLVKTVARNVSNTVGDTLGNAVNDLLKDKLDFPDTNDKADMPSGTKAASKPALEPALEPAPEPAIPDLPITPMRRYSGWFAVKADSPELVIQKLNLKIVREAGWKQAEDYIEELFDSSREKKSKELEEAWEKTVFVSPPVQGYVFITNILLDQPSEIKAIGERFEDCQYYASGKGIFFNAWIKFENHRTVREVFDLPDNDIYVNAGTLTPIEISLGVDKMPKTREEWNEAMDTDMDNVVSPSDSLMIPIATDWSVDPEFSEGTYEKGTGFVCRFQ